MRYFIDLSYRGTSYCGWQTQANRSSVQSTLEAVLTQRLGKPIFIVGSGRTDAGVHAKHQFAHFNVDEPLDLTDDFIYSLNCMLPEDIAIYRLMLVSDTAHARFSARYRYYQYQITRQKNAFNNGLTYHFRPPLNVELMNEACHILQQHTNFQSFSKARANVNHFHCRLDFAYWERTNDDSLTFHIRANRFLWGMVRTIVGTLLEVGQVRMSLDQFEQIILAHDRNQAGRAVPPNGLYLTEVGYQADIFGAKQTEQEMSNSVRF